MLVRGKRAWAGILGFFESLVWILAVSQVLGHLDAPAKVIGYSLGFATGTVLGSSIERWLAMGSVLIRVVQPIGSPSIAETIRDAGWPATVINGRGRDGDVRILFTVVPKKSSQKILDLVASVNPEGLVTIEDAGRHDFYSRRVSVRK